MVPKTRRCAGAEHRSGTSRHAKWKDPLAARHHRAELECRERVVALKLGVVAKHLSIVIPRRQDFEQRLNRVAQTTSRRLPMADSPGR